MSSYDRACNSSGYFDTSDFLSLSLHSFGCIAIPVHLFGAYCIVFQTPQTMKSVKLSLLNCHFWSCFLDFGCSLLSTPYVFVPALAGYPLGLLTYFGVGAAEQTYIMLSVFAFVTVSIIGLFENRFYILTVDSRRWRQKRKFLYFLNHVAALVCFLISYLKVPDQKVAFEFMQQFVSCIPPYADKNRIFIYTTYLRYVLIPGCVCFILFFAQLLAFPMMTNQILKKQLYKNMSDNTANLQRTFQRALVFQVALPVIILAFPVCYLGLAAQLWYHNQALNNVSFIIISSHGFFSAISMISLHAAYRDFTLTFFCYRRGSSYKLDVPTAQHIRPSIIT